MSPRVKKIIFWIAILSVFGIVTFRVHRWFQIPSGNTNFLLLGVAGKGYIGSDLTDTIIYVSLNNQTAKTLIVSLPRDIWIASLRTKLNSVYHYQGLKSTKNEIGQIVGRTPDYALVIDFNVFTKIIDILDGIKIQVEKTFDDYKYPIAGKENDLCNGDKEYQCRYEHVHFEEGWQKMDGQTALKYIRSRNAENEEGTDFARVKRQQKVILAIKNKILSPKFFLSPRRIMLLIEVIGLNIQTDIPKEKYPELFKTALRFRTKNLIVEVLNERFLVNPPSSKTKYDNQWVLIPKSGSWKEVQEYFASVMKSP